MKWALRARRRTGSCSWTAGASSKSPSPTHFSARLARNGRAIFSPGYWSTDSYRSTRQGHPASYNRGDTTMRLKSIAVLASCLAGTFFAALAPAHADTFPADSTMAKIQKKGKLVVGTSLNTMMFSVRNPMTGQTEGFEGDLARLLAKKLTGSEDNVEWVKTTTENRLPFVQNGRVDV